LWRSEREIAVRLDQFVHLHHAEHHVEEDPWASRV